MKSMHLRQEIKFSLPDIMKKKAVPKGAAFFVDSEAIIIFRPEPVFPFLL